MRPKGQPEDGVPMKPISMGGPIGQAKAKITRPRGLGKHMATHDFFTLLHARFDLGHVPLAIFVDSINLVFADDLERLFCG